MQHPTEKRSLRDRVASLVVLRSTRIGLALAVLGLSLALGGPAYLYPLLGPSGDTIGGTGAKAGMVGGVGVGQASLGNDSVAPVASRTMVVLGHIAEPLSRPASVGYRPPQRPFATTTLPQAPEVTTTPTDVLEQQTVDLINQRRVALGLGTLRVDSHLVAAARRHSDDIGPNGLCQHEGTDGSSPWDRIDQSGYTGFGNAEVVGCGYDTPESIVDGWWNSPPHHDILINPETNDIGCGWWLNPQGYGWQTCDTGISDQPTATTGPSATRTRTATRTSTPTRTNTPVPILVGHVLWEGRPSQPNVLEQAPVTLTLKSSSREVNYPLQNTDANGFFTVSVAGLANGTYAWRVKGPMFLANAGNVSLSGARVTNVEMGLERAGDANNDNMVNPFDLNILKVTLGRGIGDPGYDSRADFNANNMVTAADFNLLRLNIGLSGAPPVVPGGP